MTRLVFAAVAASLLLVGCGGGGGEKAPETVQHKDYPIGRAPATPSRPAIPPAADSVAVTKDVTLRPFFDEAGSDTVKAVTPGKQFEVYVVAQYTQHTMNAAQWRLVVPEGVKVTAEHHHDPECLTLGNYAKNFAIVYECQVGDVPYWIVRYDCVADDSFKGGEIRTDQGVPQKGAPFLGFATCGTPSPEKVPAMGGSVKLTRK